MKNHGTQNRTTASNNASPVDSPNSGGYDPGPSTQHNGYPTQELWQVESMRNDLAIEEFSEGPYGAATNESHLGKTSEWKDGQAVSGRFRDNNLISSDRRTALKEPPFDAPRGSIDGEN